MGFMIDFPTQLTFYIALTIIIVFAVFTILSLTIIIQDLEVTVVKMIFMILNLLLVLPAIICLIIFFSYFDNKEKLSIEDLMFYKEQFVLIDEELDIKYSVISKKGKYYFYEALLYNMQENDKSSNVKEFLDLCLSEDSNINCAVKYDSKVFTFYDDYTFNKIFDTKNETVVINVERFNREKLYNIKEFKYFGSNQKQSLENEIGVFVKKLVDNHINYYDTNYLENEEVDVIIKDKFPLTIDKYKKLIDSFREFEQLNNSKKLNIVFDNHKISYEKLKQEANKE